MLSLRAEGLSRKEVASRMGLSEHTVKAYLSRVYDKLGANSLLEAIRNSQTA